MNVPDQPSTQAMLMSTNQCTLHSQGRIVGNGASKMRNFVSLFLYFSEMRNQGPKASQRERVYRVARFGIRLHRVRKFSLKLQGSGERTYHARGYDFFKAATVRT